MDDDELTAAVCSLVSGDASPDIRRRVEQVLNATPALAAPRDAWRWGYALVVLAGMFLVSAILSVPHSGERERSAALPAPPGVEQAEGPVPSRAMPFPETPPQATTVSRPRTGSPERVETLSTSAEAGATAPPVPDASPWPEWSPAALEPPTAIAAADIGVAPIAVKAPVVARLQAIEALP